MQLQKLPPVLPCRDSSQGPWDTPSGQCTLALTPVQPPLSSSVASAGEILSPPLAWGVGEWGVSGEKGSPDTSAQSPALGQRARVGGRSSC